jgi:hypothetical protein
MDNFQIETEWFGKKIKTLDDIIDCNLKLIIIGLNPAPISVDKGHYFQGRLGIQF